MMIFSFFRLLDGIDGTDRAVDPDDYNLNSRGFVVIENSARCLNCKTKIESTHRHHFVMCECGTIGVDGGSSYFRRIGDPNYMEDTSIVYRKP